MESERSDKQIWLSIALKMRKCANSFNVEWKMESGLVRTFLSPFKHLMVDKVKLCYLVHHVLWNVHFQSTEHFTFKMCYICLTVVWSCTYWGMMQHETMLSTLSCEVLYDFRVLWGSSHHRVGSGRVGWGTVPFPTH